MYLPVRAMPLNSSVSIKLDAKSLMEATADINQIPAKVRRRRAYGLLKPAGAAGLALPDRRRSGPLGGQGATRSERPWGLFPHQQGPRNWLCQAAGAAAPSGGRKLHEVSDRGGNTTGS